MQVITIRIQQEEDNYYKVEIDNLSREDVTENEKLIANKLEIVIHNEVIAMIKPETIESTIIKGTRVSHENKGKMN